MPSPQVSVHTPFDPRQAAGISSTLEKSLPWLASGAFHLGLFLIAAFVFYAASHRQHHENDDQIVIPTSFTDPSLSTVQGQRTPGMDGDPNRDAAQENLKNVLKSDGWAQTGSAQNIAGLLEGQTAQTDIDFIARGNGGSIGAGAAGSGDGGGGPIAPYGTPGGGGGSGFKSTFYGTGGNANRIVYIIDHSGSMIDNFEYLQNETKRSINNLVPLQFVCVIMVSNTASAIGGFQLQRATADTKKRIIAKLDDYRAENKNDELLPPFKDAFDQAFAVHPQLIYFLTDGKFDPELMDIIARLNEKHAVHINTLAFVSEAPGYTEQLQAVAKNNGGVYKFISEKDAQGR